MKRQEIKANKKGGVTFSQDALSYEKQIITYKAKKKRPNFSTMKDHILSYLNEEKYEEINSYLKTYTPQEVNEFYYAKGKILLSWAINYCAHFGPMEFLIKNMPRDLIEEILTQNDFSMLVCFLGGESYLDQEGSGYNAEEIIKKIKLLLDFNNSKITDAIEYNINSKDFITSNVKQAFKLAKLRI